MLNYHLHREAIRTGELPQLDAPPIPAQPLDHRLFPGSCLAPLSHAIASLDRRSHQGGNQVIIRFSNGYGAIISEYRLLQ